MRLAVYLTGHVRCYGPLAGHSPLINKSLLTFLEGQDVDVFISVYDTYDRSNAPQVPGQEVVLSKQEVEEMFSELPVKGLTVCKDTRKARCILCRSANATHAFPSSARKCDRDIGPGPPVYIPIPVFCSSCKMDGCVPTPDETSYAMWENVWKCYRMATEYSKHHGFEYDYHIRTRPDFVHMQKIDWDSLPPLDDQLIIGFGHTLGYPCDCFAIGKGEAWKEYCDLERVHDNCLTAHEIVGYVLQKYPVYGQYQVGVIRHNRPQEWYQHKHSFANGYALHFWPLSRFSTKPIPNSTYIDLGLDLPYSELGLNLFES